MTAPDNQMDLFGEQDKTDGMALALTPTGLQPWRTRFESAVKALEPRTLFTSEDIVMAVGLPNASEPNANNAVGAVMNALAAQGCIAKTGRLRKSRRRVSHARELREWRRL